MTCGCGHDQEPEGHGNYRWFRCEKCKRQNSEFVIEVEHKTPKEHGLCSNYGTAIYGWRGRNHIDAVYQGNGAQTDQRE